MSYIRETIKKHIAEYNRVKTGKWNKPEPPPKNTFDIGEIYYVGDCIANEIEGKICDNVLLPVYCIKKDKNI